MVLIIALILIAGVILFVVGINILIAAIDLFAKFTRDDYPVYKRHLHNDSMVRLTDYDKIRTKSYQRRMKRELKRK